MRVEGLHPTHRIRADRTRLEHAVHRAETATRALLQSRSARVGTARAQLEALGPQAILNRGYAVVRSPENGDVIRDAHSVHPGMSLDVRVARGDFQTQVTSTSSRD